MKKYRTGVIVFFVLSLFFTVGWLAVFAFNGFDVTKTADTFFNFQGFWEMWLFPRLQDMLNTIIGTKFGFAPAVEGDFYFLITYAVYVACAITVALMVLGLVFTIKYRRLRYLPYCLVMLFATFGLVEYIVGLRDYYLQYLTFSFPPEDFYNVLFSFLTAIFAGLAYIFMIACTIWGLLRARYLATATEEAEEETEEEIMEEKPEEPISEPEPEKPLEEDVGETFATTISDEDTDVLVEPEPAPVEEAVMSDFEEEPEEMVDQPEEVVVEEVPEDDNLVRKDDLAVILKDIVREIVRDELSRANSSKEEDRGCRGDHSITGATFGGPLVVQYFNGGINGQTTPQPAPAPVVVQQPAPAPAPAPVEEKKEPEPQQEPQPEPQPEPAPAPAPAVEPEEEDTKNPIIRIPFTTRMLAADKDMQNDYNELKNEILSYGVNSRVSNSGDTFRLHRKTYVKITIAGKSLKLYFALDPADYADSKMPIGDASHHAVYAEIPLIFKVKSGLSMRRAKELIKDVMSKDGLEQGEVGSVNWVKELKANAK